MRFRAGVDIGGTFTDFALYDEQEGRLYTGKRLTTPRDPSAAALDGLFELLARQQAGAAEVARVLHATTLATNLVIERRGTATAMVVTSGFGDVLEIQRQKRWDTYDLRVDRRPPIVPRRYVYEVSERLAHDGSVITPLDEAGVRAVARALADAGVASVGVCLIHSYRNPAHERAVARILAEEVPGILISLSSDVSPIWREYERANTTAVNAYVKPAVSAYMRHMASALRDGGYEGRLLIMQSNGGLASVEVVEQRPVAMLESGPAAGALMASFYGDLTGTRDIISFDMGGTTAKACLIEDGTPTVHGQFEVATDGHKPGSGYPIATPSIDMIEIGAGGGSIARVAVGIISVGPRSAGADPGPVCYGLGGTEPTVTDADVVLGYVNPSYFAGGRMTLDREAAARAIEEQIARPLGIATPEAAWGIHHLVNLNMANATRAVSLQKGHDPRRFAFVAFGGAGPVHGARVAMDLGCSRVVFPAAAGVASAIGLLVVEPRFDLARTTLLALDGDAVMAAIDAIYAELETEAVRLLRASGVREGIRIVRSADMRFAGQGSEVTTAIPGGALRSVPADSLRAAFHDAYRRRFGYADPAVPVQGVTWRVVASGPAPRVALQKSSRGAGDARSAVKATRQVYWPERGGYAETAIYDRYGLAPGSRLSAPAVVEEAESTTVVPPGCEATVDEWLNLTVTLPDVSATANGPTGR
jgi:N-methylhydantoinase A/oxoprolinase/acetone carboxylase beta subunit